MFKSSENSVRPSIVRMRTMAAVATVAALAFAPSHVLANNFGESLGWQFKTTVDRANQAAILDLIEKRRGGYYAAPIYNTTIAQQNNCGVTATATGNAGSQTAQANSPAVSGATSTASGNSSATTIAHRGGGVTTDQTNTGTVSSRVVGDTNAAVHGDAWQALNSTQSNTGNQSASVDRSSACAFGTLN